MDGLDLVELDVTPDERYEWTEGRGAWTLRGEARRASATSSRSTTA